MRLLLILLMPILLFAEHMDFEEPQYSNAPSANRFYGLRKKSCDYGWAFYWNKKEGHFYKEKTGTLLTVFNNAGRKTSTEDGMEFTSESSGNVLSVVGNIISVKIDWYADGGAHPSYGKCFRTFDIEQGAEASLLDYFSEEDLFNALMSDKVVQNMLKGKRVTDLTELFNEADGGCKYFFGLHVLKNFAFHHINGDKVAVRIGLSHGCEVERGNFGQLGLYLPIPASLKSDLLEARTQKRLMSNINK